MHENKFNTYRVPSGLLILFLEKALTLIHMETHLNEVSVANHRLNRRLLRLFGPLFAFLTSIAVLLE